MSRSFYARTGVEIEDTLTSNFDKLPGMMPKVCIEAVKAGAEIIRRRAHDLANVSPGVKGHALDGRHMRDCIDITAQLTEFGATARIGIDLGNVPYAVHQEFGHNGKPFLRPAVDETREEVHAEMARVASQYFDEEARTMVRFRRYA